MKMLSFITLIYQWLLGKSFSDIAMQNFLGVIVPSLNEEGFTGGRLDWERRAEEKNMEMEQ